MRPKVLLFQARDPEDRMREQEHRCFVERTALPADCIGTHDLLEGPPTLRELRRFDALMVGGSGDFYVSKGDLPGSSRLFDLLLEVVETGHPTFASCFGYQCLIEALGGKVVHDPGRTEVGTYRLTLTTEGRQDELFGCLPESFQAQMGHKDRASRQPGVIPNLARSELCPYQALRIPGKPVWATQFHPELDRVTNQERFEHYLDGYAAHMSETERREALSRFEESPEASSLLACFIDLVFG